MADGFGEQKQWPIVFDDCWSKCVVRRESVCRRRTDGCTKRFRTVRADRFVKNVVPRNGKLVFVVPSSHDWISFFWRQKTCTCARDRFPTRFRNVDEIENKRGGKNIKTAWGKRRRLFDLARSPRVLHFKNGNKTTKSQSFLCPGHAPRWYVTVNDVRRRRRTNGGRINLPSEIGWRSAAGPRPPVPAVRATYTFV